ncbi:peptidase M4 family protein, partial [Serratia marcescens]
MPAQRMRSVIPPYMLRRIIEHGNAPQRDCALHTLNHVQSLLGNKPLRSPTEKNARAGEALRDIYDAQNGTQLPGKQVRKEGQPSNHDVAVDEAYDYLGVT